jgi:serine/threonine protein phosphatase PrpC
MLEDDVIADILASDVPVAERASALIDAANARGGVDNITAVVVRIA